MWNYEKRLQFPVKIRKACPRTASLIISQFGGPDGELAASMRYLSQRYTMSDRAVAGLLTDIGTEELAHLEMVCAMIYQLTKNMKPEDAREAGFEAYYIDHTAGIWPTAAAGVPFNACEFQSKGDSITDLFEDLAAEQKARSTYENLIRVIEDPDVLTPLKFLREREIVHFQRFGEALEKVKTTLDEKNFYYFNPEFDWQIGRQQNKQHDRERETMTI
ncbi:MAG: manganese catalase family protein [Clostridiales bacterium]|nr:manganese catalase family protein [Clostridiales bacterium]